MENIFEVIETALVKSGYQVMDGDSDSVVVRRTEDGADFEIKVSRLEEEE